MGKCIFNNLWLSHEHYKLWLLPVPSDKYKARCKLCAKSFEVGHMGESSLKAHMNGKKHMALQEISLKQQSITGCFQQSAENEIERQVVETVQQSTSLSTFLVGKEALSAEIIWGLKCVSSHFSFNSSSNICEIFKAMFPDSDIAKQFTMSPKKVAYLCCFGIAPHMKELLLQSMGSKKFVLLFDETLNRSTHSKQLDLLVRYWHPLKNEVCTKYLNSVFMGHSSAVDLLNAVKEAIDGLNVQDIIQISMDGPAVNLKMYTLFQSEVKAAFQHQILNVGTCGLHVLHNAVKAGIVACDWQLDGFLRGIYQLFKDSPARLEDYKSLSNTKKMPLQFCRHRWLDNLPCVQRAIEILDDLKLFVANVESKKIAHPNNLTYENIVRFLKDKLLIVKLNFFSSLMGLVQPFLTLYQTDSPMLPFFAEDLIKLIRTCFTNFNAVKEDELKYLTVTKFHRFENEKKIYNAVSKISLGFRGDKTLQNMINEKSISENETLPLKQEVREFIFALISKILDRSPIKFAIVRNVSCFDPKKMSSNKEICINKFQLVLNYLVDCAQIKEQDCEAILLDFKEFLMHINLRDFANFKCQRDRLDHFFSEHMFKKGYVKAWEVTKIVLLLSHGQASVERGFSINKNIEVENMKENSYVSLRLISDYINSCGGVGNVPITKELLSSAAKGRQRYMAYLEQQKKENEKITISDRKRKLKEDLDDLNSKRKIIESDVKDLMQSADELSMKAESSRKLEFCIQSNSLRKAAKEKESQLKSLEEEIKK